MWWAVAASADAKRDGCSSGEHVRKLLWAARLATALAQKALHIFVLVSPQQFSMAQVADRWWPRTSMDWVSVSRESAVTGSLLPAAR